LLFGFQDACEFSPDQAGQLWADPDRPLKPISNSLELVECGDAFIIQAVPCSKRQPKPFDGTFPALELVVGHQDAPL
jgi:hypothetical protein